MAAAPLAPLDALESEAIYILREAAAQFRRPAILFSGGKESSVLVHLARKAFRPAAMPWPLLHIETGHNFAETIATGCFILTDPQTNDTVAAGTL